MKKLVQILLTLILVLLVSFLCKENNETEVSEYDKSVILMNE